MLQAQELKRRLDAFRTLRGMRQVDLAELLEQDGHDKTALGRIERGDPRVPFAPSIRRSIATHLEIPEEWLTEPTLNLLGSEPADDAEITTERLDELVREMTDYLKIQADLNTAKITARLDRIDERLGQLKQRDKDVEDAVAQIRAFAEAGASSTPPPVTPLPRKGSRRGKTRKAAGPGHDGPQR